MEDAAHSSAWNVAADARDEAQDCRGFCTGHHDDS
jgi:hypothetical protein